MPIASDWAAADTVIACEGPIFPAFERDEMPEFSFSDSPGIGDGAKGVEGDGTTKGEFAACNGVPVFAIDVCILC